MSKHIIQNRFNSAAATYHQSAFLQKEIASRLLERIALLKETPRRIVDVGCGTGFLTTKLQTLYPESHIIGLDFAFSMCQKIKQKDFDCLCADAHKIPIADNSIDLLTGSCMLQWTDPEVFFHEARRVLKPGGILFLSTLGPDTLIECRKSWEAIDPKHPHVHSFADMHDLGDLMLQARFEDPVADRQALTITYPHPKQLLHDLKKMGAQNVEPQRLRGLLTPRKLSHFYESYKAYQSSNALYPATCEIIFLHASKPKSAGSIRDPIRIGLSSLTSSSAKRST